MRPVRSSIVLRRKSPLIAVTSGLQLPYGRPTASHRSGSPWSAWTVRLRCMRGPDPRSSRVMPPGRQPQRVHSVPIIDHSQRTSRRLPFAVCRIASWTSAAPPMVSQAARFVRDHHRVHLRPAPLPVRPFDRQITSKAGVQSPGERSPPFGCPESRNRYSSDLHLAPTPTGRSRKTIRALLNRRWHREPDVSILRPEERIDSGRMIQGRRDGPTQPGLPVDRACDTTISPISGSRWRR